MVTKLKILLVLVIVHLLTSYMSCRKNCAVTNFSFAITSQMYPDNDSINVGDTIWVEVDAPVNLVDIKSGVETDYSGAVNLGNDIYLHKFDKVMPNAQNGLVEAAHTFRTHLVVGDSVTPKNPSITRAFRFKEISGRYRFKVGLIPQEKGDFMIGIGSAAGVYRSHDQCSKADFSIAIAETNQHLYLYQNFRPGYEFTEAERLRTYCVRVQ